MGVYFEGERIWETRSGSLFLMGVYINGYSIWESILGLLGSLLRVLLVGNLCWGPLMGAYMSILGSPCSGK